MSLHCPFTVLAVSLCAVLSASVCAAKPVQEKNDLPITLRSPEGRVEIRITTRGGTGGNSLSYDMLFDTRTVLSNSPLGVILTDNDIIADNLKIESVKRGRANESYSMPYGKTAKIRNRYNEAGISLFDPRGRRIVVVFRAFDDGAAFRYSFPRQESLTGLSISGERSGFTFTGDDTYWGLHLNKYTTSYEKPYTREVLSGIDNKALLGLPVLVRTGTGVWAAVTEADIDDYAGMYLRHEGSGYTLSCSLSPLPGTPDIAVRAEAPHSTPWRVIMLGDNPGRLVESNIVLNLNEPCALKDVSWIRPGRVAWDWWSGQVVKNGGFEGKMDDRTMKYYIDFAAEAGLEYMLVDAGWYGDHTDRNVDITRSIPEIDVPGLVQYARAKGVGIILWLNWGCVNRQMDTAFPLYEKWGVRGVKIDYMNRDDQEMVNFYRRTVKKAAECRLLVNFHGAFKPDGWRRTYPNLITREGVMGLEYDKWSDKTTPDHDCTLPFTRMLAGPMDYTPGGFTNATKSGFTPRMVEPMTQGTRCHQLALYVIFENPLQMLSDHPDNYRGKKGIEFLKAVPATWDDTKVLHAEVGEHVTIARRHGKEWYLGSITNWTPRDISIPLNFLDKGGWTAEVYADGADANENAESVDVRTIDVKAGDTLSWHMAPGGGYAVRFKRK